MRELVYLSERKLQQFMIGKRRFWSSRTPIEGEITFPGLGGVKVGPTVPAGRDRGIPDLEKVISALEISDRAARWFTEDDVQPGEWVHFEAPLCYGLLGDRYRGEALVFLNRDEPNTSHRTGGTTRLLMHGSAEHLLTAVDSSASRDDIRSAANHTELRVFANLLYRLHHRSVSSDPEPDLDVAEVTNDERHRLERAVPTVIEWLDYLLEPRLTAAWMAGYARVTAVLPPSLSGPPVVVATPLYVEHVSPPSAE